MKFDRELVRQLVADETLSQNEIAKRLSIDKSTFSKWLARNNLRRPKIVFNYDDLMLNTIKTLRHQGVSFVQIGYIVAKPETTVRNICKRFAFSPEVAIKKGRRPISDAIKNEILNLRGTKHEAIAAMVGVSTFTVSKVLKQGVQDVTKG